MSQALSKEQQLVTSIKQTQQKAKDIVLEIGTALVAQADARFGTDKRKEIIDGCATLTEQIGIVSMKASCSCSY